MFNLFSKKEEPKSVPIIDKKMKEFQERMDKEAELYNKIIKNDDYLALALKIMIHRIDTATPPSILSEIGTLESRIEKTFEEQYYTCIDSTGKTTSKVVIEFDDEPEAL